MVTSVNGKSTKDIDPPFLWASKEDQIHLYKLINQQKLIVMGKNTYFAAKKVIKLAPGILRIVITDNPGKFRGERVSGQLEFSNETPKQLVNRLKNLGYKQILLLGGSKLNKSFLEEKSIDELWLTIEPLIFGSGLGLVDKGFPDTHLKLISVEKLNKQGTLLLKYKVNDSNSN